MMKFVFNKAPQNIYEAFHPISWVYIWHSYFPFTFVGDPKNGNLKTTSKNIYICIFWVLIFSFLLYHNITAFSYDSFEVSTKLMHTADQFSVIFGLVAAWSTILYQMYKRKNIKKFLVIMQEFDEKVKTLFIFYLQSKKFSFRQNACKYKST